MGAAVMGLLRMVAYVVPLALVPASTELQACARG